MTWKFVTTWPSASQTKPEPSPLRDLGDPEEAAPAAGEARDEDDRRARLPEELDRRLLVGGEVAPGRHGPRLGGGGRGPEPAAGGEESERREEERSEERDGVVRRRAGAVSSWSMGASGGEYRSGAGAGSARVRSPGDRGRCPSDGQRGVSDPADERGSFPPLAPGTLVGRYRILASVGSGAMGEVYRAEDTSLGRVVALKTLPGDLVGTPDRRARFENEGRVMASLSHPNLVHVYDVGEFEGIPYLVQEFIEGETLEDVLLSGPVAAPKAARWIAQAAEGLAAVHDAGILHRDIKPSNLMVGRDGRIRVLDFGLAKVQAVPEEGRRSQPSLTTDGLVVGTAQYMSPEQASGKKADARSDIFSLGIVFYELLAGKLPFEGETAVDVMYAILHLGHRADPRLRDAASSRGFADVVDRALAKDPEKRFPTMREMADGDRGGPRRGRVGSRASSAAPRRASARVPRVAADAVAARARRRRRLALLAVAAGVLAAVLGAAFVWRGHGRERASSRAGAPLRPGPAHVVDGARRLPRVLARRQDARVRVGPVGPLRDLPAAARARAAARSS